MKLRKALDKHMKSYISLKPKITQNPAEAANVNHHVIDILEFKDVNWTRV